MPTADDLRAGPPSRWTAAEDRAAWLLGPAPGPPGTGEGGRLDHPLAVIAPGGIRQPPGRPPLRR